MPSPLHPSPGHQINEYLKEMLLAPEWGYFVGTNLFFLYVFLFYFWRIALNSIQVAQVAIMRRGVIKFNLLWTWQNPTENCDNSGICRRISSVTRWTPRCCGLKLIFRWNHAEPIWIPRFEEAMLVCVFLAYNFPNRAPTHWDQPQTHIHESTQIGEWRKIKNRKWWT